MGEKEGFIPAVCMEILWLMSLENVQSVVWISLKKRILKPQNTHVDHISIRMKNTKRNTKSTTITCT